MPTYDPRYIYPRGYEYGNVALGLADLLGQGFDRMHKWDQDTQAQGNRDQEYLMKLQQFMQQNEDRTLDRGLKQQTADLQGKQIEDLIAKRKTDAENATNQRSALGKFFGGLGQDVPTQEPAPMPAQQGTAISPQAEDRTLSQFVYGKRKATPQDAVEGMGAEAANLPTSFTDALLKFYQEKAPKPPEPFTLGEGQTRFSPTGETVANVPKVPKSEKAASMGADVSARLRAMGLDPETADPAAIKKAIDDAEEAKGRVAERQGAIAAGNARDKALGPQPITAEERQRVSEGERSVQLAERSIATLEKNPTWVGGPLGLRGRAREWQSSLNMAPPGFAEFQADVAEIYGTYARRIAGAALTPTEKKTYLAYLPNITTDSDQQFAAKLKAFPERVQTIDAALDRARLGTAAKPMPTTQMPPLNMDAIDAELKRRGIK